MVVESARRRLILKMVLSPASVAILIRSLFQGENDSKAFPLVLDELLARTTVLRVKVQSSYNESSVIRLYEDPNLIKKSVSMTADHDPEQRFIIEDRNEESVNILHSLPLSEVEYCK
ncbi:hypothetical protein Lal_00035440, partial [Lupinus albus]